MVVELAVAVDAIRAELVGAVEERLPLAKGIVWDVPDRGKASQVKMKEQAKARRRGDGWG